MNTTAALKKYFGYDSYKPGQEEIINAILAGKDVLAVMPTGAGKSVCYQIPATLMPGITIVISPLISLMQDQVKALNEAGIRAGYINSSLSETQISKVYANAAAGMYKLLYVAPERLGTHGFMNFAGHVQISMVTVDEAHCISQWGQDFRPSYLRIVGFIDYIEQIQGRPVVSAFTATATREVRDDIACMLMLRQPETVVTGFDRENLFFDVKVVRRKDDYVLRYIKEHPADSGIIYCATRKNVDKLYDMLCAAGVSVARYHAGMTNPDRKDNQDDFVYDRASVIVATNAFGMGIDKSNVRFVIHYNMPQSMENYYQEAGRAGRDGAPAQCILLFSRQDIVINRFLLDNKDFADVDPGDIELIRQRDTKRLRVMEDYCKTTECLRNYILAYFGEKHIGPCENCGNCHREFEAVDMTAEAKQVINCVWETKGRYGLNIVLGTLLGANRARLKELGTTDYRTYGVLRDHTEDELRLLIGQMLRDGYLHKTDEKYSVIRMGNIEPLRDPDAHVLVRISREREREAGTPRGTERSGSGDPRSQSASARTSAKTTDVLTKSGYELFAILRELRLSIAREIGMPPYIIFSDRTLAEMSAVTPLDREAMLNVSGVGEAKFEKYGERFIGAITAFLQEHPGAVTAISGAENVQRETAKPEKKRRINKQPFRLNPEDREKFVYNDQYLIAGIRDELNRITTAENVKHLFGTDIFRVLKQMGYVEEAEVDGIVIRSRTDLGIAKGISSAERISKSGKSYEVLLYPPAIQKEIVDHYAGLSAPSYQL